MTRPFRFLLPALLLRQPASADSTYRRYFIGSSLFRLANLNTRAPNRPDFVQLNAGHRITPRDVVAVEVRTWRAGAPAAGAPVRPLDRPFAPMVPVFAYFCGYDFLTHLP